MCSGRAFLPAIAVSPAEAEQAHICSEIDSISSDYQTAAGDDTFAAERSIPSSAVRGACFFLGILSENYTEDLEEARRRKPPACIPPPQSSDREVLWKKAFVFFLSADIL